MNSEEQKKEYEIMKAFEAWNKAEPSEALLRSVLEKIPEVSPSVVTGAGARRYSGGSASKPRVVRDYFANIIGFMSTMQKLGVAGVAVFVIVAGVVYHEYDLGTSAVSPSGSGILSENPPRQMVSNGDGTYSVMPTSPNDTSNTALNQDSSSFYDQMNGLNSDSANLDQSFNDQPIAQN